MIEQPQTTFFPCNIAFKIHNYKAPSSFVEKIFNEALLNIVKHRQTSSNDLKRQFSRIISYHGPSLFP